MDGSRLNRVTDRALWARIRGAHLPVERDGRDFHQKLSDIAGISEVEARALEREYRRFLYLSVVTGGACVAPELVHLAWAYHAGLDGYGEDFCHYVLGRKLRPGAEPAATTRSSYAATWQCYHTEFGIAPPAPVWPLPELGETATDLAAPVHSAARSASPTAMPRWA